MRKMARSFGQWCIDTYGEDYLNKVWNEQNVISPFDYAQSARKTNGLFNCENNPNHVYELSFEHFWVGQRCPYCAGKRVLYEESLGCLYPDAVKYWSDKNKKTPFEYTPSSSKKVFWKCPDGKHKDFERIIQNSVRYDFRCNECKKEETVENGVITRKDMIGQTFGTLTVKDFAYTKDGRAYWLCDCSCGAKNVIKQGYGLRSGNITNCGDRSFHKTGENNPNWKGGISPELVSLRSTPEYKEWRTACYRKDFYTCQCCGEHGGNLSAHHINDFATYEDLRFDVSNSITLCDSCHDTRVEGSLHNTYGTIGVTPHELEVYINNRRKELGIYIPFSIDEYMKGNILTADRAKRAKLFYEKMSFIPYCGIRPVPDDEVMVTDSKFVKIKPKFRVEEE